MSLRTLLQPCRLRGRAGGSVIRPYLTASLLGLAAFSQTRADSPAPAPSPAASVPRQMQSPPSLPANSLAPFEERLANAKSVKVMSSILGLSLGSSLEHAHEVLDKLCDKAHRPKEEKEEEEGEGERKVLWELARSPYSFVFVKADEKEKISYISGFLRPGKEMPFERIGETKKAPVQDANTIAWDVVRPKLPLFRVVAAGQGRKASSIMIFVIKRPSALKHD